jgi:hypothetical protein
MRFVRGACLLLILAIDAGSARRVLARGGSGPPVSSMTAIYCRETVYSRTTGAERFEEEVRKCIATPVTYPPAYK